METGLSPAQVQHFEVLEGNAWRSLDGVICASPSTRKSVLRAGVDPARVQVSSPGVDVPAWPTQPPTRGLTGGLRLLCVAHVTARKGHAVLVQALAMLRDQAWTLDCYGSLARDPNIAASLRADIQSLGLGERITLHGEQPPECLSSAWWQADAFVLPSHHEGYGMVLTEAIAHGLPIVSTRAGAIAQTAPALASVLVEPGDAHALAHALQALLLDRSRLAAMRQAARVARESLVSWHDAIGHWHMALQRLLSLERAAS
jgi:glycosyltransferase involved in cell wall biosynthesis